MESHQNFPSLSKETPGRRFWSENSDTTWQSAIYRIMTRMTLRNDKAKSVATCAMGRIHGGRADDQHGVNRFTVSRVMESCASFALGGSLVIWWILDVCNLSPHSKVSTQLSPLCLRTLDKFHRC